MPSKDLGQFWLAIAAFDEELAAADDAFDRLEIHGGIRAARESADATSWWAQREPAGASAPRTPLERPLRLF